MLGCSFSCVVWVCVSCAEAACFRCRWTGDEMIWPFHCWISPLQCPHRAKLLQPPALLADVHVFAFPPFHFYISTNVFSHFQTENEYRGKLLNQRWTRGDKISRCRPSLRLQSRPIKVSLTCLPNPNADFLLSLRNRGFCVHLWHSSVLSVSRQWKEVSIVLPHCAQFIPAWPRMVLAEQPKKPHPPPPWMNWDFKVSRIS